MVGDRMLILRSGIIETEFQMVDFDQITDASVEVTLRDILLGLGQTGNVSLTTRGSAETEDGDPQSRRYVLSHVFHPYDLFRLLEHAEYDVKADMAYPNELRPADNSGYRTTYAPDAPASDDHRDSPLIP